MTGARREVRRLAAAAVLAAAAATPLAAQERVVPAVGDRVRVASSAARETLHGDLVAVRGDTMFIHRYSDAARVAVPLAQVSWIEVRQQRSGWEGLGRGLLYGVPIGFGGGYVLGVVSEGRYCGDDCGLLPAVGAAAGLVVGTVLGTIIGVTTPGGRWVQAQRPVAAPVAGGGVALSIGIDF